MAKCKWRLDAGQFEVMDDAVADMLRSKTPAECVEMVFAANRTLRLMVAAGIRNEHPDWDELQVKRELARRMSGGSERVPDSST